MTSLALADGRDEAAVAHVGGWPSPPRSSWFRQLLRHRWGVLWLWAGAQWWIVRDHTGDWRYFDAAARYLFGARIGPARAPGGIHLFSNYPVQFGPPPILLAEPAHLAGGAGRAIFGIAIMSLCVPTLWLLQRTGDVLCHERQRIDLVVLVGGLAAVPAWGVLAYGFTHMDDALVLFGAALTLRLIASNPLAAAVTAGTAAAAKPWGVVVLGLLVAPHARKKWLERPQPLFAVGALVLLAWWAPFLLDPHTIAHAGTVQIPIAPHAPLHLLVPHAELCPLWVRPVQLAGGLVLSLWTARRSPTAALVLGISFRLLIDPGGYGYYWCGLLVAAMAYAVAAASGRGCLLVAVAWLCSQDFFTATAPTLHAVGTAFAILTCMAIVMPRGPLPIPVAGSPPGNQHPHDEGRELVGPGERAGHVVR